MTDTSQPTPTPPPLPHGSESLEVWEVLQKPWKKMGTIVRHGGRKGKIVCTPPDLEFLLNRPRILGYDEMDYLEPQRIGERVGDQRFRQSMSFAVRSRATAKAN